MWLSERIVGVVTDRISIDPRALAIFRVTLGILVAIDILLRIRNLSYFYTDEGVVSTGLTSFVFGQGFSFFFALPDVPAVVAAYFVVYFIFVLQLIAGYRTKLAVVAVFLFAISVDRRNPFVLSYADYLLNLLLFWGIFLPLGQRWSVDAARRTAPSVEKDRLRDTLVGLARVARDTVVLVGQGLGTPL